MPRATIVVAVDDPEEFASVEAWFTRWRPVLTHCSDNFGCGCCVDIWEVEATPEAIADLPPRAYAGDEWTNGS